MCERVTVKQGNSVVNVNTKQDLAKYYSDLSKKWAVDENIVDGNDYSSKHYATVSKASADEALQNVETAKNDALIELERDALQYISESKSWSDKSHTFAQNSAASAQESAANAARGVEEISAIIQSTPEKFAGFGLFDTKLTDHILTGQDATGWALQGSLVTMTYADAVDKVKELYENGEEIEYRGVSCKRAADGRYVADITQKELIDALFADTGVADFYVLDSENSQFYLPRSNWFNQITVDTSLVNNFNEAGLPNITGYILGPAGTSASGALTTSPGSKIAGGSSANLREGTTYFNANLSNAIYSKSDTVQPLSSNKLLYYKVGNTVINETQIDVGNLLSELEAKANVDLGNATPAQNFKEMCVSWGIPDYTGGISISNGYIAPTDGWVRFMVSGGPQGASNIIVNGTTIIYWTMDGVTPSDRTATLYVSKGDVIKFSGSGSSQKGYFYPLKGVIND